MKRIVSYLGNGRRSRRLHGLAKKRSSRAFLLPLVMLVIAIASLTTLNFSRSMLNSNEASHIDSGRLQARMCAESGAQTIRLLLAQTQDQRLQMGGTWSNPTYFYAKNVMPDVNAQRRGNFTVIAPSLDQTGNYAGIRFGLQNESTKLNLNALVQLDSLAQTGSLASAAMTGNAQGQASLGGNASSAAASAAANSLATAGSSINLARDMLMALPGMTLEIADSILDWLDTDDDPRTYGAEADYYASLQPAYQPANGPLESIEQLLLVRGMTPGILYGYDENRNGFLDPQEQQKMSLGIQPGQMLGQVNTATADPNYTPPAALGLSSYLTLHSLEKNVAYDGSPRININKPDLQALYEELQTALGDDTWASFIIAYRIGGVASTNPLTTLLSMAAHDAADGSNTGAMATQLQSLQGLSNQGRSQSNQQRTQSMPWNASLLSSLNLSQGGSVQFQQVLDLYDATVTLGQGGGGDGQGQNGRTYTSPFASLPLQMAQSAPLLLDKLTTTDAKAVPGRINIMECPREILMGIPGLTDEVVDEILSARNDGSESQTRRFEAWLAIEGYLTLEELRGLTPLICCSGDVFKAQVVGYLEGDAAYSRIEMIVNAAQDIPAIQFFRRLDHLGRGFSIATLGQRPDSAIYAGAGAP